MITVKLQSLAISVSLNASQVHNLLKGYTGVITANSWRHRSLSLLVVSPHPSSLSHTRPLSFSNPSLWTFCSPCHCPLTSRPCGSHSAAVINPPPPSAVSCVDEASRGDHKHFKRQHCETYSDLSESSVWFQSCHMMPLPLRSVVPVHCDHVHFRVNWHQS